MRHSRFLRVILVGALCLFCARPAAAQMVPDRQWPDSIHYWNFWVGFFIAHYNIIAKHSSQVGIHTSMRLRSQRPSPNGTWPARQGAGGSGLGGGTLHLVASLDHARFGFGNGEGGFGVTNVLGGLRLVGKPRERFAPYVQGSAGIQRAFGETALVIQPGGGILVPVRSFLLTAGVAVDIAFPEGGSETGFKISGGLSFPIGAP